MVDDSDSILDEIYRLDKTHVAEMEELIENLRRYGSGYSLHGKPHTEVSKLKVFMDVFNGLTGEDKNDVDERYLVYELVKTGKFTEDEAMSYIKKASQNGLLCKSIVYHTR
jgi:hypothetical protein